MNPLAAPLALAGCGNPPPPSQTLASGIASSDGGARVTQPRDPRVLAC